MNELKGIDLFSFRAYVETTGGVDTGMWSILTDIFINFLFSILNIIVLIFSTILELMESFSVYELYKKLVYETSFELWKSLIGNGSGSFVAGSVVVTLFSLMGVYLFVIWLLGRHNFSQKVIHVLAVIILSLGYFGTIQGTSGGLFVLDGIRALSNEALRVLDSTTIQFSTEETIDTALDFSESYITQTSYQTYLYVNTGNIDGTYFDNQTEQLEEFDNSKVLGQLDIDGNFKPVLNKDREKYIEELGHGAKDNGEKNRWVSAVSDYFFMKLFYVSSSIFKAIIVPIPYIVIHLFRIIAEILVLVIMLVFPFILVISFIPALQNYLIGSIKLILVSSVLPAIGSLMILVIAFINKMIEIGFESTFQEATSTKLLVSNFIFSFISIGIYYIFWKYKGFILLFFSGGNQFVASGSNAVLEVGQSVGDVMDRSKEFYKRYLKKFPPEETGISDPDIPEVEEPSISDPDIPEVEEPSISDPDISEVEEPSISDSDIPEVEEPSISDPDIPEVEEPSISDPDIPEVEEPSISDPDIPEVEEPSISNPDIPEVEEPSISDPDIPEVEEPSISDPDIPEVEEPSISDPDIPEVEEPSISDPDIPEVEEPSISDSDIPEVEEPSISNPNLPEVEEPSKSAPDLPEVDKSSVPEIEFLDIE